MLSSPQFESGIYFSRFLDTVGDGTGTKNANGNYLAAVQDFFIAPPETQIFKVARIVVQIAETGVPGAGFYGNGLTLVNGISVLLTEGSTIISDYTDGLPIFTNSDYARYAFDVSFTAFGAGLNYISARWTFEKGGNPVLIPPGRQLRFRLNDNFTGIVSHTFCAQGLSYG